MEFIRKHLSVINPYIECATTKFVPQPCTITKLTHMRMYHNQKGNYTRQNVVKYVMEKKN